MLFKVVFLLSRTTENAICGILDTILVAIRIATYGEKMDLEINVPVTAEKKSYDLDLRHILDTHREQTFEPRVRMGPMLVTVKPLNYAEFTKTALKTFEEQRIFRILNDEKIPDAEKIEVFQKSFKALTDITIENLENAIYTEYRWNRYEGQI